MRWAACAALLLAPLGAQQKGVLNPGTVPRLEAKRGQSVEAAVPFSLEPGYHTNSNTPSEDYLIPLRLSWEKGLLEPLAVRYPKAQMEKYDFSAKPLSVYTGKFEIVTRFQVPQAAAPGPGFVYGKLRYQACTSSSCLPPKTIEVRLPVTIR